jgi:hypothetical protein
MVGVGNIVSVGGSSGGSGGGSTSGIQSVNGAAGPAITLSQSGIINILRFGNTISIGAQQSGVLGVNGVTVNQIGGNFVVDTAALSGLIGGVTKFAASFTNLVSGQFTHNLGTLDVIVQVRDNGSDGVPRQTIIPDKIVYDNINTVSVIFNRPQSGRIIIL